MVPAMKYTKFSPRDPEQQNEYMWSLTTFESVLETIRNRSIVPVIHKYLKPGDRILEAGCGNGAWINFLHGSGYIAVGIDNNINILQAGKGKVPLVENDVLKKCFKDNTFIGIDVFFNRDCLQTL